MKNYIYGYVNNNGEVMQVKLYSPVIGFDREKCRKGIPTPYLKEYDLMDLADGGTKPMSDGIKLPLTLDIEYAKRGLFSSYHDMTDKFIEVMAEITKCDNLLENAKTDKQNALGMAWDSLIMRIGENFMCDTTNEMFSLYFWDDEQLKPIRIDFPIDGIHLGSMALWSENYGCVVDLTNGEFLRDDMGEWYSTEEDCRKANPIKILMFND